MAAQGSYDQLILCVGSSDVADEISYVKTERLKEVQSYADRA
jgi:hypothetical protein